MFLKIWIILFLCFSLSTFAQEEVNFVDKYQSYLSSQLLGISNSVDYFFGGIRMDDEANGSVFRINHTTSLVDDEKMESKLAFRLRLELPGTQKRFKLIFDDGETSAQGARQGQSVTKQATGSSGTNAAIRFLVQKKKDWNVQLDTGLKIRLSEPLNPFTRLRGRKSWFSGHWQIRGVQEFYYYIRTKGESRTTLDFDYPFKNGLLFRYGNNLIWTDVNDFFNFSTGPTLYQKISDKRAINYNIKAIGDTSIESTFTSYDFFLTYRQLLHKNWLFVEVTPGIQLPKIKDFQTTPFIVIQFQAFFGNF